MALVNHKIKKKITPEIKYYPENLDELIEYCRKELALGNTDLNCIDTSKIVDMGGLFDNEDGINLTKKEQENLDVSYWDVSNVKNMVFLFFKNEYFNGDLSSWDVSNVENMRSAFRGCKKFNCDISDWRPIKIDRTRNMFRYCESFNQNLEPWNLSKSVDMRDMFTDSPIQKNPPSWYTNDNK